MKTISILSLVLIFGLTSCNKEYIIKTKSSEEFIEFQIETNPYYEELIDYKFNGTIGEVNKQTENWLTSIPTNTANANIELLLAGDTIGNYADTKENITIKFNRKEFHPHGDTNSLNATVTKYDEVGGFIEGTFSGKAISTDNNDTTYANFKNGKLKVIRDF